MVVFPLKCTCIPYLLHMCLMLSAVPLVYGMTICPMIFFVGLLLVVVLGWLLLFVMPLLSLLVLLLVVLFILPVSSQLLLRTLFCTLCRAQCGYLQLPRAPLRCFSSSLRSSGVVQTALGLWVSVPMRISYHASPIASTGQYGWAFGTPGKIRNCLLGV